MPHRKFEFPMPASEDVVFDAFHYHQWRARWDSLVSDTHVVGDAPCPYVGAISENNGAGLLRKLSMRTQFVTFDRPRVAAATMIGTSFPFTRWAASMRHRATGPQQSVMIYTYNFDVGPVALRWIIQPFVVLAFNWQTRRRFTKLQKFLTTNADEVVAWQQSQRDQLVQNER